MKFSVKKKRITMFNAISLTDIILLLLIFFLLSSSFVMQSGIKVKLPKAKLKEESEMQNLIITVTRQLDIYINNEAATMSNLEDKLSEWNNRLENPEQVVIIRSDEELPVKFLVKIIEKIKRSGFAKFLIAVQEG